MEQVYKVPEYLVLCGERVSKVASKAELKAEFPQGIIIQLNDMYVSGEHAI